VFLLSVDRAARTAWGAAPEPPAGTIGDAFRKGGDGTDATEGVRRIESGCRDCGLRKRDRAVAAEVGAACTVGEDAFGFDGDVPGVLAGSRSDSDVDVSVAPVDFLAGCACTAADCV